MTKTEADVGSGEVQVILEAFYGQDPAKLGFLVNPKLTRSTPFIVLPSRSTNFEDTTSRVTVKLGQRWPTKGKTGQCGSMGSRV
ncbi:hypothetical protein L1987_58048 [Smallanthus sonchifolius]|uniref:Uncharacterized protein n=1 Tax=Smallanthus sonchifolius TaxID=185202 RepID=A0ACB9DE86_9ASTR|nr:hypothetical protein L1987_58048 [Smallanthus sonchifolius]